MYVIVVDNRGYVGFSGHWWIIHIKYVIVVYNPGYVPVCFSCA
jgi:hypothetical protein